MFLHSVVKPFVGAVTGLPNRRFHRSLRLVVIAVTGRVTKKNDLCQGFLFFFLFCLVSLLS